MRWSSVLMAAAVMAAYAVAPGEACAACLDPPGDLDGSGAATVVDVQCAILGALWELSGGPEPPDCLAVEPVEADLDCDGSLLVTDVLVCVALVLGKPLSPSLDADGDQCADACVAALGCGDLAEHNLLLRWTAWTQDGSGTQLSVLDTGGGAVHGQKALRAVTLAPFDFAVRWAPPPGQLLDAGGMDLLRLIVRGKNVNVPTWQGNFPQVVLVDSSNRKRIYTPTKQLLSDDGATWSEVKVPLAGGPGWTLSGQPVELPKLKLVEVHADTWGAGFTLDLDGVSFQKSGTVCAPSCPGGCSGHGSCDAKAFACVCDLGYAGSACAGCAEGFTLAGGTCALVQDGSFSVWPNPVSKSNGDAWLRVHHAGVKRVEPRVLVLSFVNKSNPKAIEALVDQIFAGFAEGSRPQGYADAAAEVQLQYLLARPIVDLRDGAGGKPPAPAGWPYENSTLYPRKKPGSSGAWSFDYAQLFSADFAEHYGFEHPTQPGASADLCTLIDAGLVHELWVVGSGDVPDVNAAEVLEHKQKYTSAGNPIPGLFDSCAGNGCFDADVPKCARSVRIGWVNYNRGPGCYLHSHGHGMESTGVRNVVPAMTAWFMRFARFDLDQQYALPVSSLYGSCGSASCIAYPTPSSLLLKHGTKSYAVDPYDGVCGNVHFPPNGTAHYDYFNWKPVLASCEGFGRHEGSGGADSTKSAGAPNWASYGSVSWDCGGEFLVWWYQNMPGHGSGQVFDDGSPMRSAWPFLFY